MPTSHRPTVSDVLALAARDEAVAPTLTFTTEGKLLVVNIWSHPKDEPKTRAFGLKVRISHRGIGTAKADLLQALAVSLAHRVEKCACDGSKPCPAGLAFLRSLEARGAPVSA